ncbi:MAG: hypothetical protein KC486_03565 [Myxococcales bacterium]|nr:hypothetical protein [Myxococcales bacterium]
MDSSYRHLAFLLSLGGVPLACTGDDTSTSSDTASTTGTSDTTSSTSSSGTDTSTTGTTTDTGSGTATMGETGTTTTAGETTTGETTTGGGDSACASWATKYVECYPRESYRDELQLCEDDRADLVTNYGDTCGAAFDALYECLSEASCDAIENQDYGDICPEAYASVLSSCAPEIGEVCMLFGDKYTECNDDVSGGIYCQMTINYAADISAECGQAQEDYFACLTALDCADFDEGTGCETEAETITKACE